MSIHSQIVQAFSRRTIKKHGLNQPQTVRHLRKVFNNAPTVSLKPLGVSVKRIKLPHFRGERISVKNPKVTILYFHGGAFIGGVTRTYHNLASRLAKSLQAEVYLATYPLAPESPYPAAVDRCVQAYEYLLTLNKSPENIILAGDSAGGGLVLTTLLKVRDRQLPMPQCAVLLSPATCAMPSHSHLDLRCSGDAMLSADMVRNIIDIYLPNPKDRIHPYASPAFGDYQGLPPMLFTVSRDEILYTDALMAKACAERAGIDIEWIERSGVFHVWPIMVPFLPEANRDFRKIVRFIRRQVGVSENSAAYTSYPLDGALQVGR